MADPILAAVMVAPRRPIEIREFPKPDLAPGAALLRTISSEVCGTDVHLWHGRLSGVPYPIIPGHVSIGTLEEMRGPLTGLDGASLREGDQVVFFDVHRTCGRCRACQVHQTPTRCPSRRVYGITDPASEGLLGGWTQAIYLEPGVSIARLPEAVSVESYIGGGCGLLTSVHILDRASIEPGQSVLVQGTGAVGLSAIALARIAGAGRVFAIGAPADRRDLARQMGADEVFDLSGTTVEERADRIRAATHDEGVDVAIEAAGSARAIEEGVALLRDGGRYVIAGHYTDVGDSRINGHRDINRKHLEIRGCWGSEARHLLRALSLLEQHADRVPWNAIGGQAYGLHQLNDALADAEAMKITKALVQPQRTDGPLTFTSSG